MDKRKLFTLAMKAENYKKLPWILSAFCLTKEDEHAYIKNNYPYRIISTSAGYYFCDPQTEMQLTKITDASPNEPLYSISEIININENDIPNLDSQVQSTYGKLLANWILIYYPFGKKIPYINGPIDISYLEKSIVGRLRDTPPDPKDRNDKYIYVDEYLKLTEAADFCTGMSQICVVAATKKTMTAAPGIIEYRKKLLIENKEHLDEAVTVAKINAQLVQYDSAYLKGDPGENFLISKKSRQVVRQKLFLMYGAEAGLDENTVNVDLIEKSLSEGWDVSKFPSMMNALRAGSFNRGAQTELGGVSVKWLQRASANINVTIDNCGTKLGKTMYIDKYNKSKLIGMNLINKNEIIKIEDENEADLYLGKLITVRSPAYCIAEKTDFCKTCVGDRLSQNPYGVSMAVSECGSTFLSIFMAAAHGRALILEEMDYLKVII